MPDHSRWRIPADIATLLDAELTTARKSNSLRSAEHHRSWRPRSVAARHSSASDPMNATISSISSSVSAFRGICTL